MITKEDLVKTVEPLTKSVTKLGVQFVNLSISFNTFEQQINKHIENMQSRMNIVEVALSTGTLPPDAEDKFAELQKQIQALQLQKTSSRVGASSVHNQMDCTAVFGNFANVSADVAEAWIVLECDKLGTSKIVKDVGCFRKQCM